MQTTKSQGKMSFLEKAWNKNQSLENFAFSDFLCIVISHIEISNARGEWNSIELLVTPAFTNDLSFFLSLSPLQGCSCSVFHGGDAQPLPGQPKDSLLSRLGHAGHHLWLGSLPSRDDCPHLYPPVNAVVSDRRVRAVDTRKHFRDTWCSPGLGFVVRNHGLAALLFSRFDLVPASMVAQLHHLPPALGIVPVWDGIVYKNPRTMFCPAKLHMWSRSVALGACTQVAEWWAGRWHWRWLHSSWRRRGERVAACCEGMTPGTSGPGRLRGRSLWDSTCPADRHKMAALWGVVRMGQGCPWPRGAAPRSAPRAGPARGIMAGECGSVGRDRCCFLHFHIVHQAPWNPFSCGASGDRCPLLMLPSTVWAAGSGEISQAGILVFFNGQLRKKTFSWEKS